MMGLVLKIQLPSIVRIDSREGTMMGLVPSLVGRVREGLYLGHHSLMCIRISEIYQQKNPF
jgi:hypothetical protein